MKIPQTNLLPERQLLSFTYRLADVILRIVRWPKAEVTTPNSLDPSLVLASSSSVLFTVMPRKRIPARDLSILIETLPY